MKKIFVALLLLLLPAALAEEVAVNATAQENVTEGEAKAEAEVHAKAIEARYEIITYGYNKTLAAMEAVIGYLAEKGVDTTNLTAIKSKFVAAYAALSAYAETRNASGFGKQVAEMHKIAAKFKHATAQLVPPGQIAAARARMIAKIKEKESEPQMVAAAVRARAKQIAAHLAACEINIGRLEELIARAHAQNVTTIKLSEIVREIRAECAALSANDTVRISRIKERTAAARGAAVEAVREINEKGLARAIAVVSALERKGINISDVAQKLQAIESAREAVRTACVNATAPECAKAIAELRQNLSTIGEQIKVIARGRERAKILVEIPQRSRGR